MPRPLAIAVTLVVALSVTASRAAHANGAFPESFQLLLPVDRPQQIALATNFGLIISDDDGATWTWTCEQEQTINGFLYAVGPPTMDRFYSVSTLMGLAYSDDASCSWKVATGALDKVITLDFFPDPTNALRVLAIGEDPDGLVPPQVFPSDDGGATFKEPIFTAGAMDTLSGVEIARSDPMTIYVAMYSAPGIHPKLARSLDGGKTWKTLDVEASLGPNNFRIIAIDPADPKTITLRVIEPLGEGVAISHDGGETYKRPFTLEGGVLKAYAKLDSGTILVSGIVLDQAHGFRSTDGGLTFQDWKVPHLLALGARGGKLYAAAKNYTDDWAVGVSTDEGMSFTPLTRYDQVKSIRECVQATCLEACQNLVTRQVWDRAVCGTPPPVDALPEPPVKATGCGCDIGSGLTPVWVAFGLAGLTLAVLRRRQRR